MYQSAAGPLIVRSHATRVSQQSKIIGLSMDDDAGGSLESADDWNKGERVAW